MNWLRRMFRPRRYHHRSNGPVVINPDRAEVIHVWGTVNPYPPTEGAAK